MDEATSGLSTVAGSGFLMCCDVRMFFFDVVYLNVVAVGMA